MLWSNNLLNYNSIGQELSTALLSNQNKIIDASMLEDGLYFLKIIDGHKIGMKKVIIDGK
jgi:hypothetical protein